MQINRSVLKNDEKAIFELRDLYSRYGYTQYKMSKFEAYDLYVRNKDFLVSDNIITFTDTDGKLLALKPDVTLSIIKNSKDTADIQKVYYNENVYRVSKSSHAFKEIMQVGLECIGDIDAYNIYETVLLAAESLKRISPDFALDISHLDLVTEAIGALGVSSETAQTLLAKVGEKNVHEIDAVCKAAGAREKQTQLLKTLASTYGTPKDVLAQLGPYVSGNAKLEAAAAQLGELAAFLSENGCAQNVFIDFSVVNDMNYYNGIVFRGFIGGIPTGILSGGEYDKLMQKMGRRSRAIGFAVYLDMLERFKASEKKYDVDVLLVYDGDASAVAVSRAVRRLGADGRRVLAARRIPEQLKYKQLLRLKELDSL